MANITIPEACMICENFLKRVYQIQNAVESVQSLEVVTNTAEYNQLEQCVRLMARVAEKCESNITRCESHISSLKHTIPVIPIRLDIPIEELDRIRDMLSQIPASLQLGGD